MRRSVLLSRSLMLRAVIGGMLFIGLFFSNSEGVRLLPFATDSVFSAADAESNELSTSSSATKANYNFSVRELSSKRQRTPAKEAKDSTEQSSAVHVSSINTIASRELVSHVSSVEFYHQPVVKSTGVKLRISGRAPPTLFI